MGSSCSSFRIKRRKSPEPPQSFADKDPPPHPPYNDTPITSQNGPPPSDTAVTVPPANDTTAAVAPIAKKLKIFIVFYSMYGHVELMARSVKKGVDSVDGVEGVLYRVPETLSPEMLEQMKAPNKDGGDVPVVSVDSTGLLWSEQRLAGKPAGFFVSTGTQGGGQETTAWTAITQLTHHGMIYVPIGYTFGAGMFQLETLRGGSPYGAGVFSGDGTRQPHDTELALADHHGKYMATIVTSLHNDEQAAK